MGKHSALWTDPQPWLNAEDWRHADTPDNSDHVHEMCSWKPRTPAEYAADQAEKDYP